MLFLLVAGLVGLVSGEKFDESVFWHNGGGYIHKGYGEVCEHEPKELVMYLVRTVKECEKAVMSFYPPCIFDKGCKKPYRVIREINVPDSPTGCFMTNDAQNGWKMWFNVNRDNKANARAKPICQTTPVRMKWEYGQRKNIRDLGDKMDTGCEVCESWSRAQYNYFRMDMYFGLDTFLVKCEEACIWDNCWSINCKNTEEGKMMFAGQSLDSMLGFSDRSVEAEADYPVMAKNAALMGGLVAVVAAVAAVGYKALAKL